jgi:hypothetical protein
VPPSLELDPQPGGSYYTTESYPNLYRPGDELVLTGAGQGDVPGFELRTRGIDALTLPTKQLMAVEHEDMVVTWNAASSPAGSRVIVHMDNDHHGISAYVECVADDTGALTIPAAVLDRLILAGESGIGTYIENAWIARVNTGTSAGQAPCVAFRAESLESVLVDTIRAD